MTDPMQENLKLWNDLTPVHERSAMYDLAGFKQGKSSLEQLDLEEVGTDLTGKSLLHLQCHFGKDTLSWARLGASVTGADFSDQAIALAQRLSQELSIPARFVCSNLYDLPGVLSGQFDIVYTGVGAICWLPDLSRWAEIIAHYLKPGGMFYIRDGHPFMQICKNDPGVTTYEIGYPYFHGQQPLKFESEGDYADPGYVSALPSYEWIHPLSTIINELIAAGLHIEFLHEHQVCEWQFFPFMEQGADGLWRLPANYLPIPLTFSIKATKR